MLKHLLVVALATFLLSVLSLILILGLKPGLTISLHIAQKKFSARIFAISTTITTVLLAVFFFAYFAPAFGLSVLFYLLAIPALLGVLFAGIFPRTEGKSAKIHELCAWAMAGLLVPLAVVLTVETFSVASLLTKIIALLFFLYALPVLIYVKSRPNTWRSHALFIESVYIAIFCAIIISLTYF